METNRTRLENISQRAEARIQELEDARNTDGPDPQAGGSAFSYSNTNSMIGTNTYSNTFHGIDYGRTDSTTSTIFMNDDLNKSMITSAYDKRWEFDEGRFYKEAKRRCPFTRESEQANIWIRGFMDALWYLESKGGYNIREYYDDSHELTSKFKTCIAENPEIQEVSSSSDSENEESGFDIEGTEEEGETNGDTSSET